MGFRRLGKRKRNACWEDRGAVTSGTTANDEPWQYYDLGHGYCTYTFFEQCPHRMACARCDFHAPKASGKAQLLEDRTTCSAYSSRSHSTMTNAQPSRTASAPSTTSSTG